MPENPLIGSTTPPPRSLLQFTRGVGGGGSEGGASVNLR